jgi:ABC-type transporter Mla subunit MlaD
MFEPNQRDQLFQRGVALLLLASVAMALAVVHLQRQAVSPFGQTLRIQSVVPRADGVTVKSPVTIAGIKVGWVDDISLTAENQVLLTLAIDAKVSDKLRADSLATVVKPMLGTALIEIQMGHADSPVLQSGAHMAGRVQPDLNDIVATLPERLNKAEHALDSVTAVSENLRRLTEKANASSQSVDATLAQLQSTARKANQAAGKLLTAMDAAQSALGDLHHTIKTADGILENARSASRQLEPMASQANATLADIHVLTQELRAAGPQVGPAIDSARQAAKQADDVLDAAKKSVLLRGEFPTAPPLPTLALPR